MIFESPSATASYENSPHTENATATDAKIATKLFSCVAIFAFAGLRFNERDRHAARWVGGIVIPADPDSERICPKSRSSRSDHVQHHRNY